MSTGIKFGLQVVPAYPAEANASAGFAQQLEQVRAARDAGFSSLWVAQHFVAAPFQYLQTIPTLGRLVAEAGDLTIGTCVLLLPLTHPVRAAEELTTLDIISGGKLIVGVGAGYSEYEMRALGLNPKERLGRLTEGLTVLEQLWTGEPVTFQGRHYQLDDVQLALRPVQQPRPPIWVGAMGEAAVRRAARFGDSWIVPPRTLPQVTDRIALYRKSRSEAGRPMPEELPLRVDVVLANSRSTALDDARPALMATHGAFEQWGISRGSTEPELAQQPFDEWVQERMIVGDPEHCLARLGAYRDLGVNHFIIRAHFPGLRSEHALRTIRLIGEEVLPTLTKVSG